MKAIKRSAIYVVGFALTSHMAFSQAQNAAPASNTEAQGAGGTANPNKEGAVSEGAATSQGRSPSQELSAQTFVTQAGIDGMAEVQLGKLAEKRTHDDAVRKIAQRMVRDHSKANSQLRAIARRQGLHVPAHLDAEHRRISRKLMAEHGKSFDTDYLDVMAQAHDKAITLFTAAETISDPAIAAFAAKTLPVLREHKEMIDRQEANSHTVSAP